MSICIECGSDKAELTTAYNTKICSNCREIQYWECEICGGLIKDDDVADTDNENIVCVSCCV